MEEGGDVEVLNGEEKAKDSGKPEHKRTETSEENGTVQVLTVMIARD